MTWPIAPGITRDVPGDLGDPLLNMWILGWGAEHLPRVISGQVSPADFWNANIFHPEPLALSFSEHLFGQALQILPIYHLTGNLILCYNLLFLSTFLLSGMGMYLLVRDLLDAGRGFSAPAFLAGLMFAFVPLRIAQIPHIQIVSSQWMPFALYGFRRFITAGATTNASTSRPPTSYWPLIGGSAALLLQNWSCGYYLIYFTPFVVLFVVQQMVRAGRLHDYRLWLSFLAAALIVAVGTWPFLSLYLEAQRVHGFERPLGEVIGFSADLYGYLTASESLRVWGSMLRMAPKPEGEVFLGIVPMLLAAVAVALTIRDLARRSDRPVQPRAPWTRYVAILLVGVGAVQLMAFFAVLITAGFVTSIAGIPIRANHATRLLTQAAVAFILATLASGRVRLVAKRALSSTVIGAAALTLLAVVLSLGPAPMSHGQLIPGLGLYAMLYDAVPGVNGLRVPARVAMIAALFLCMLAGLGAEILQRRWPRARLALVAAGVAFLIEACAVPLPINLTAIDAVAPPPRVYPPAAAPPVYRAIAALLDAAVITELPFGDPAWELRYVYYSTVHWRRLVNGYSGAFPAAYKRRLAVLQRLTEDPDRAWQALVEAGTTHVVLHETAYVPGAADAVRAWLSARGGREIGRFESDVLYSIQTESRD